MTAPLPLPAADPRPSGYEFSCPDGEWTGRLDVKQWGNDKNLTLYFTDVSTGERYWFSVFSHEAYRPRDGRIAFEDEEPGTWYLLTTRRNSEGKPIFLGAMRLG